MFFFPFLIAGWIYRRKPEIHKRLMIVATTILLLPAIGRMTFLGVPVPLWKFMLVWPLPVSTRFNVREYDLIAEWYASERVDQTGVPEATTLASSIPRGSLVLDVGCGNGKPITRALLSGGHRVIGLDSSSAMLASFKHNCPEAFAVRGIVQSCPFADCMFDAAFAWGVMFHLNPEDTIKAIANVSRIVKRGATFLFTSGDADSFDGKEGKMNGVTFRYFSYSVHNYRRILGDHGFTLVDVHADSGNNTYYLAKKTEPPS